MAGLALAVGGLIAGGPGAGQALAVPGPCTLYASTSGSDTNPGTQAQPFRNVQKLVNTLTAGGVGCLASGQTFVGDVIITSGGTQPSPITLTTTPGGTRATVKGTFEITNAANDVVVEYVALDSSGVTSSTSPTINGDRVVLRGNDITNGNTARICVHLGDQTYGEARNVLVEQNRIHNCGLSGSNLDHGIYVNWAQDTIIRDNFFYDNATYGVHLYPRALGTKVYRNVIDGNGKGVIFSGAGGVASNNNEVYDNIITNSANAPNIESWYPAGNPIGTGNTAHDNCLYRPSGANVGTQTGFTATNNTVIDPQYANRAAKDFTVPAGNPCAAKQPIPYTTNQPPVFNFQVQATFNLVTQPEPTPEASQVLTMSSAATDPDGGIVQLVE